MACTHSYAVEVLKAHPVATSIVVALAALAILNRVLAKTAERRNPPKGRFITVDGVRLHYVERGRGSPLVLLHGNGSMIQDFESSGLVDLAAKTYRVIAFDRPGFGYSDRPRTTVWTPEAQADGRLSGARIRALLGNVGCDSPGAEISTKHPGPDSGIWLLLPDRSGGCTVTIAASVAINRLRIKPHHIAYSWQTDLAASSSQDFWAEPYPKEIRRLPGGDGYATISDPGWCGGISSHDPRGPQFPKGLRTS
jgi:alpha/beta hydrolase fold